MKKVRAIVLILLFVAGIGLLVWFLAGQINSQLDQSKSQSQSGTQSSTVVTGNADNSGTAPSTDSAASTSATASGAGSTDLSGVTEVTTIKLGSLTSSWFETLGTVRSKGTVSLFPLTSGSVKKVNFQEGDYVKPGDVILEITGSNLTDHLSDTQLKIAETTLANTKASYENLQRTSAETLKTAQLQLQSATNQAAAIPYDLQVIEQNKSALEQALDILRNSLSNTEQKNDRDQYKSERDIDIMISNINKAQDDRTRTQNQLTDLQDQLALLKADPQILPADPRITAAQSTLTGLQTALTAQDKALEDLYTGLDKARYGYSTAENGANLGVNQLEGQIVSTSSQAEVLDLNLLSTKTKLGYTGDSSDALNLARQAFNSTKVQLETALDSAANGLKLAELNVEIARSQAAALQLKAPFAGVLTMLDLYPGQNVNPQTAAAEIIDPKSFELEVGVDLNTADRISTSTDAVIELAGREIEVPVKSISPKVDDKTRLVNITVGLPNIIFKANQNLKVKLPLSTVQASTGARYLPLDAVIIGSEAQFVYVNDNGKAKKVDVKIGQVSGDQIEILSGLPENAEVILKGARNLTDGQSIKVVNS
jgi:RND family efflux transporter MFP subunit